MQQLLFTNDTAQAIESWLQEANPSTIFIVCDSNTRTLVVPDLMASTPSLSQAKVIAIGAGDENKNLQSLTNVWKQMGECGGTRRSVVINAGGGVVTDLGGFAAATFKRGVRFLNMPTTLLSAVDAAVGGKTGINFGGLKNEIGAFCNADVVVISTRYFATLPPRELLSGYAEMLKHGLISSPQMFASLLAFDIEHADLTGLLTLLRENVMVKERIVAEDPHEKGLRRALNLGHTSGHAFESWALHRGEPVPHGYAVAWGLVVDLVLSHLRLGFPSEVLQRTAAFVRSHYGSLPVTCNDYDELLEYMRHDKKNSRVGLINFTLLRQPGEVCIDCQVPDPDIVAALDIFRDLIQ